MPKDNPQRNHRQRTEDRKLLEEHMGSSYLGGLTVDKCEILTDMKPTWPDTRDCPKQFSG